jgi:hypothetical protein
MLVRWFEQNTYHMYNAHHKRKRRGEVPILGDIPRNVSKKNYFGCLASDSASFQACTNTAIVPQDCKRAFAKQCICLDTFRKLQESVYNMYTLSDMYASTSSTLVVIGVIGNTQTVRDRERREKERESEQKRESLDNRLFPLESHRHRSVYAFVLCAQLIAQRDRLIDEERNDRHRTYGNLP